MNNYKDFYMKNKINEASIKLDVNGLESNDFETLSRMLALAGQAESEGGMNPGFSSLPKMEPFDFDSVGDETQPIMDPASAMEPASPADGAGDLGAAVDDLEGSITDFGAGDDVSLDLDGQPELELDTEDDFSDENDFSGEDDFDMDRMSSLAGLGESVSLSSDEEGAANDMEEDDDELSDDEEAAAESELDEALLPDLSLDEDAEASEGDRRDFGDKHHVVDSKEHGPFRSHSAAVHDAMRLTNGTEYEHFVVIPGKDGFYWRRNLEEELDNEPEPCTVDMAGIENSRHPQKRVPGTALGDNPLAESEDGKDSPEGNEEDEEDDKVEDILESINARYDAFIKGL